MSNWFIKQLARIGLAGAQADELALLAPSDRPISILLVDDTPANIQVLMETLKPLGHKLLAAKDGESALAIARRARPSIILLDVMMPGMDGYEVCRRLKDDPDLAQTAVIFCSALDDTAAKVRGLELGAVDFVTKPFEPEEVLARVNTHIAAQLLASTLVARNQALARELAVATAEKQDALRRLDWVLLGSSRAMRQLQHSIGVAAASHEPVLLKSPPDAGAEAVARAIHAASTRRDRPFITIDAVRLASAAGSLEPSLFDVGGATPSRLELADGGTIFIDRIDQLPDSLLNALADYDERAQAERDAQRAPAPDVRLIATTGRSEGRSLPERVPGSLRLSFTQLPIELPGLAERREDIPTLIEALVQRQARATGKQISGFDKDSLQRMSDHAWPGNLRELEDVVARSVAAAIAAGSPQVRVDPALLQVGVPLGSYRLVRKLGAGGFGEVWEARHQMLARPSAVKLILNGAADETMAERFRREAAATASLASPHTVTLYDFGVGDTGQFYYVMELLDGIDLEQMFDRYGKLPPERMAHFLVQACRSLAEAHERGMIHRDIKPSNLFTCRLGIELDFLKVLDFGLVRKQADPNEIKLTQQDMIIGTPAFMAPEAASERPLESRTDIYSLAATAWYLLAGRLPFDGSSPVSILMGHLRDAPPDLLTHAPEVPKALAEVVMAGLAKEAKDRPTALEMARVLVGSGLPQTWDEARREAWWSRSFPMRTG